LSIARLIAVNRSPSSHLAGGAAIHLAPAAPRISNDLDYFHDEERLVAEAFAQDRALLETSGYAVEILLSQPGFVRAIVRRGQKATKVEWAHDSAWRFLPPIAHPDVGFHLHPIDLAINKVLALAGRDEPRDFLDALYVHRHHLSLGSLCWAAVGKDPGYNPELLVEMLARKGRYRAEDFAMLQLTAAPDLADLKRTWIKAIDAARRLVRILPATDAGCLYLDPDTRKFVTPSADLSRLLRHHGTRGGVLPAIGDQPMISADLEARRRLNERYESPPAG
jgi:hypothetical protein